MNAQHNKWLARAELFKPELNVSRVLPAEYDRTRLLGRCDVVELDFGRHLVGHVTLHLGLDGVPDSPTRIRFVFGERREDLVLPPEPYVGRLSRAWVQDEVVTVDHLPATISLPRRYAFRYLKLEIIDTSASFKATLEDVYCLAGSSADDSAVPQLPQGTPDDLVLLDAVGLATLRSCMQTVFEDGPKRDRRLWTGDLRLQVQANALSFRNFDLVRRCLYLLSAFEKKDGWFASDVYEGPAPRPGRSLILDYAVLLGPILLDHLQSSGDERTARELFPLARLQLSLAKRFLRDGLLEVPEGFWLFSDWRKGLDKQAPTHATILFSARQVVRLADLLGEDPGEAAEMLEPMNAAARTLLDTRQNLFVSGKGGQVSWASAAWMVLAGVVEGAEARRVLQATLACPHAVRPATPYLYHHVVEALVTADMDLEAGAMLRGYWGKMIARGADTYDEVFDPDEPDLAPYGHPSLNSHCHAWSCTPVYFIRRYGRRLW
ncbi:MAG: glycoside hydrolase [Terrimicrobiaceae bacterium]